MIVDCHTQIWDSSTRLGQARPASQAAIHADTGRHLEAANLVDRAIVLAFKSTYLQAEIPNEFVADYVRRNSAKMVGFAGIDPTDPDWPAELRRAHEELRLKGTTISPAMQNFHPSDSRAMRLYEACAARGMPLLVEVNLRCPAAKMEFARPMLFDEIAREWPDLPIVIAHMGYPWVDEAVVLLGKHKNVFANVAGLLRQPWLAYTALLTASEAGVIDKLLFGSDFPYRSPAACIESLYSINVLSQGTNLATIPREQLRGIVERDALKLLGIESAGGATPRVRAPIFSEDEAA